MIRIPNEVDCYIQCSKVNDELEKETRRVASIVPIKKENKSRKQYKNETLFSDCLIDNEFSDVLSEQIQKKKTMDIRV